MAKNSKDLRITIVALYKVDLDYKKIGTVTAWNWVTVQARVKPRFFKASQSQGSIREVESSCCASDPEAGFINRRMSAASQHCLRCCRSGRSACQCSDHTPNTATRPFGWSSSQKEASSEAGSWESPQTVCWKQPDQGHELQEPCPVAWWD